MRLFHHNENGEEITTHINCPIGFISSYSHFVNQTTSDEYLQCVTDCELLRVSKESLEIIYSTSVAFKDYSIYVYQQSVAYHESRARELASLTALQRYRNLLENYPAILQNVPQKFIASFLGMKPESLSRIRKQKH